MSDIIVAISLESKRDAVFQLCRRPSCPFHTQTLSCVLLVSVCLCMLVAPSQKEDLIATVMAGKIITTHLLRCTNESLHFCATVLHGVTDLNGDWLLDTL